MTRGVLKSVKHERFARALAQGKTLIEAYASAGYKPNDSNAAKLANAQHVKDRVSEILEKSKKRAEVSIASILCELEDARQLAMNIERPGSAIIASMSKAKLMGLVAELLVQPLETKKVNTIDVKAEPQKAARAILYALNMLNSAPKPVTSDQKND